MANALRSNIPLYKQTDPRAFPDYEMREYPKVMTDKDGAPLMRNPTHLMTTPKDPEAAPKEILRDGKPIVIGGEPITVANAEEEAEFLKTHPEAARIVKVPLSGLLNSEADEMEAGNARMRALIAEREELEAKLAAPAGKPAGKKRGPKSKAEKEAEAAQAAAGLPADLT